MNIDIHEKQLIRTICNDSTVCGKLYVFLEKYNKSSLYNNFIEIINEFKNPQSVSSFVGPDGRTQFYHR